MNGNIIKLLAIVIHFHTKHSFFVETVEPSRKSELHTVNYSGKTIVTENNIFHEEKSPEDIGKNCLGKQANQNIKLEVLG